MPLTLKRNQFNQLFSLVNSALAEGSHFPYSQQHFIHFLESRGITMDFFSKAPKDKLSAGIYNILTSLYVSSRKAPGMNYLPPSGWTAADIQFLAARETLRAQEKIDLNKMVKQAQTLNLSRQQKYRRRLKQKVDVYTTFIEKYRGKTDIDTDLRQNFLQLQKEVKTQLEQNRNLEFTILQYEAEVKKQPLSIPRLKTRLSGSLRRNKIAVERKLLEIMARLKDNQNQNSTDDDFSKEAIKYLAELKQALQRKHFTLQNQLRTLGPVNISVPASNRAKQRVDSSSSSTSSSSSSLATQSAFFSSAGKKRKASEAGLSNMSDSDRTDDTLQRPEIDDIPGNISYEVKNQISQDLRQIQRELYSLEEKSDHLLQEFKKIEEQFGSIEDPLDTFVTTEELKKMEDQLKNIGSQIRTMGGQFEDVENQFEDLVNFRDTYPGQTPSPSLSSDFGMKRKKYLKK